MQNPINFIFPNELNKLLNEGTDHIHPPETSSELRKRHRNDKRLLHSVVHEINRNTFRTEYRENVYRGF